MIRSSFSVHSALLMSGCKWLCQRSRPEKTTKAQTRVWAISSCLCVDYKTYTTYRLVLTLFWLSSWEIWGNKRPLLGTILCYELANLGVLFRCPRTLSKNWRHQSRLVSTNTVGLTLIGEEISDESPVLCAVFLDSLFQFLVLQCMFSTGKQTKGWWEEPRKVRAVPDGIKNTF
jgi:hypothetical protein